MKEIPISKFKTSCISLIKQVKRTGESILITKSGEPIAQIMPPPSSLPTPRTGTRFGCMAGTVREISDIVSPLGEGGWEVLRD